MSGRIQGLWRRAAANEWETVSRCLGSFLKTNKRNVRAMHSLAKQSSQRSVCLSVCFTCSYSILIIYFCIYVFKENQILEHCKDLMCLICVVCTFAPMCMLCLWKKGEKNEWLCWTPSPVVIGPTVQSDSLFVCTLKLWSQSNLASHSCPVLPVVSPSFPVSFWI